MACALSNYLYSNHYSSLTLTKHTWDKPLVWLKGHTSMIYPIVAIDDLAHIRPFGKSCTVNKYGH